MSIMDKIFKKEHVIGEPDFDPNVPLEPSPDVVVEDVTPEEERVEDQSLTEEEALETPIEEFVDPPAPEPVFVAKEVEPEEEEMMPVQVSSHGMPCKRVKNDAGENVYIMEGSVNGKKFEIECDTQVMVPKSVYEALQQRVKFQRTHK